MHAIASVGARLKADLAPIEAPAAPVYHPSCRSRRPLTGGKRVLWATARAPASPDASSPRRGHRPSAARPVVIEDACQQLRAWPLSLPTPPRVDEHQPLGAPARARDPSSTSGGVGRPFGLARRLSPSRPERWSWPTPTSAARPPTGSMWLPLAVRRLGTGLLVARLLGAFPVDILKIDRSSWTASGAACHAVIHRSSSSHSGSCAHRRRGSSAVRARALQHLGFDSAMAFFRSRRIQQLGDLLPPASSTPRFSSDGGSAG